MKNKREKKEGDLMKSLLGKVGVILIGLLIFVIGCQKTVLRNESTMEADWKLYSSNEYYYGYYDAQNIICPCENVVIVWTKSNFTKRGVLNRVGDFGKKYENLSYTKVLMEINCAEKKLRRLSESSYDNEGNVIYSLSSLSEWDFIIPESPGEILYKEVCK